MESRYSEGDTVEIGKLCNGDFFESNNLLYKFAALYQKDNTKAVATCFTKGLRLADMDFFDVNKTVVYKGYEILK